MKWTKENPEKRQFAVKKYTLKNSSITRFWKPYNIPSYSELKWIKEFGLFQNFDASKGKLSTRLSLRLADLKESSLIIIHHHYLHRTRAMAQLPYWICIDGKQIGVLLFSLPRISVPVDGVEPMKLLELARIWIHPSLQNLYFEDRNGKKHSLCIVSCAVGKSLKRVKKDWYMKYPTLPEIDAIISWSDDKLHKGTIYKASNFKMTGKSGGNTHGSGKRKNSGHYILNKDFKHIKTRFMYGFN